MTDYQYDVWIKDIHDNAVEHGFWGQGRWNADRAFALIHTEISEAVDADRKGDPLYYELCVLDHEHCKHEPTERMECETCETTHWSYKKPEGVAVEFVDAAIRMMDFMGGCFDFEKPTGRDAYIDDELKERIGGFEVCELADWLHELVVRARRSYLNNDADGTVEIFFSAITMIEAWIDESPEDIGFVQLLKRKHQYNCTRPILHGKKY